VTWQSSAVGNLKLSLPHFTPFPSKGDGSDLKVAIFLAGYHHLMKTPGFVRLLTFLPPSN